MELTNALLNIVQVQKLLTILTKFNIIWFVTMSWLNWGGQVVLNRIIFPQCAPKNALITGIWGSKFFYQVSHFCFEMPRSWLRKVYISASRNQAFCTQHPSVFLYNIKLYHLGKIFLSAYQPGELEHVWLCCQIEVNKIYQS